jgi:HEAT repeat protein
VGVAAMLILSAVLGRFERRRTYVALPSLLALLVAVERAIVVTNVTWIYRALWLTTTLGMLIGGVVLWGTAGLVTDTRRAKRLFPLFGAGTILGSVLGGLLTKPLAAALGAENLLVIWVVALVATSGLCAAVVGVRRRERRPRLHSRRASPIAELRQGFGFVRRTPLLIWMSLASIAFSVLFYSLYLPFAQASTARYPDPDALAGFFGLFYAAVTAVAFVISVLLANRLLGRFGAATMLLVLPLLYAGGFGVLLVTSAFATLVAIRFGIMVWLQGISSAGWETVVNVTPEDRRDQTRAFLNGGPAQVGTAIAGIITLVGQDALGTKQLAVVGLVAAAITVFVMWRVRSSYAAALVDALKAGRPSVFEGPTPNLAIVVSRDAQSVELATSLLGDEDTRTRRLATHLLEDTDDDRAVAALRGALRDPDADVRADVVRALSAHDAGDPALTSALDDPDPRVRLAAVRAVNRGSLGRTILDDPDPAVATAGAARLLATDDAASLAVLQRALADDDPDVRASTLRELALAPSDAVAPLARAALDDPSATVRAAALRAMGAAATPDLVPLALEVLGSDEPAVGDAAIDALARAAAAGVEVDVDRLVEERTTLASTDSTTAAAIAPDGGAGELLRDALMARARADALVGLSAASVASPDRAGVRLALDVLRDDDTRELANALEALEVAVGAHRARPLLALWEPGAGHPDPGRPAHTSRDGVDTALGDRDPLIRSIAEYVRSAPAAHPGGDGMPRTMSPIEMVLVLRRIPLFAALEPAELERVSAIAEEDAFADGEVIGVEGEPGDALHIVLDGRVRVARADGSTITYRGDGDVVGEMSLIMRAPRVASLIAEGDVRTLRIGHRAFEGMLRERPDIALAVMRVLAERLAALSAGAERGG